MLISIQLFEKIFLNIITITFSSLIFAELMNVYSTIHQLNKKMIISQLFAYATYILSIMFLRKYINTSIINLNFFAKVGIILLVIWTPIHIFKCIKSRCDPTEEQKLKSSYSVVVATTPFSTGST